MMSPSHLAGTYRRIGVGFLGVGFLVVGFSMLVMGVIAFVFQGQTVEAVGALIIFGVSFLGIILGIVLSFKYSVETSIDNDGLLLTFVWSKEKVRWDQINWYKYMAWRWGFVSRRFELWTIIRYSRSKDHGSKDCKALLALKARESFVGLRVRNYTTDLNGFIPTKDRTRREV